MEIWHLKYFVAVAENLHFGRAAQQLHMSQPPLFKRIAAQEDELGTLLFITTGEAVALSAAGQPCCQKPGLPSPLSMPPPFHA
jgi:LysR family transcriptional regulator, benzoate and cis,cis-muconate-responsive activator of ben and cat genes